MIKCVECGTLCSDGDIFCPVCGTRLSSESYIDANAIQGDKDALEDNTSSMNNEESPEHTDANSHSKNDGRPISGGGYTKFTIPKDDPNHIKDLFEICSKTEWVLLQEDAIKASLSANNISPEKEPRICLALVNRLLITKNSFINRVVTDGEMPIYHAIRRYTSHADENYNAALKELIIDLQKYVKTSDSILGEIILAALISTCAENDAARSLAAEYLDRVVPKGAYGLLEYLRDDQIVGLLFSALWICDYLGFRAFYRKMCPEIGTYDALSRATLYDKALTDAEASTFLQKYADKINDGNEEELYDDTENAEKFIKTYQQYAETHDVSGHLRFAFLALGFQYARNLIFASAGLVTGEYFNSELDKYLDYLSPEGKKKFLDSLLNLNLNVTRISEELSELGGPNGGPAIANWRVITEHVEALAGVEHHEKSDAAPPAVSQDSDTRSDEINDIVEDESHNNEFEEFTSGSQRKRRKIIYILMLVFLGVVIITGGILIVDRFKNRDDNTYPSGNNSQKSGGLSNLSPSSAPYSGGASNYTDNKAEEPVYLASPDPNFSFPSAVYNQSQVLSGAKSNKNLSELQQVSFYRASATSQIYASGLNYYADKAIDGSIKTSWQENVEGQGIGESLTVFFDRVTDISYIGILAGSFESEEAYYANSRIKKAQFEFSDGASFDYYFDDIPNISLIELSQTVSTRYIKITIEDVFPGKTWDDTAIAEVFAYR